jgi:protein-L-isoaspartate(D-aspartate) O-methyltransferase
MLDTITADELRGALVDRIAARHQALGLNLSAEIARALRTVPRHLFTGDVPLEEAYGDNAVVTVRGEDGVNLSSVSAPWLQALMLGQAALKPGDRVLEVGSGGYNAALIRELVGPDGSVTTVDIDSTVTDRAQRCLADAGYTDVEVICADVEFEIEPGRTWDVILVTVGMPDISPALWSQLADEGRLIVPLRTLGLTRSWVLERQGAALASRDHLTCGFVPLRGAGSQPGQGIPLREDPGINLWLGEGKGIDAGSLSGILDLPRAEARSGVTIEPATPSDDQDLWLASSLPGFCLLVCDQAAIDDGIVLLSWPYGTPAFVDRDTLAYRGKPVPVDVGEGLYEFVAYAHGPDAEQAVEFLAEQIAAWDRAGRPSPRLWIYPAGTPDSDLVDGFLLDKRHSRVVISWPSAR